MIICSESSLVLATDFHPTIDSTYSTFRDHNVSSAKPVLVHDGSSQKHGEGGLASWYMHVHACGACLSSIGSM